MHVNRGDAGPLTAGSPPHSASWSWPSCSSSPHDTSCSGTTVSSSILHASVRAFLPGRLLSHVGPWSPFCSSRPSLHVASSMEPPSFPRCPRALPVWARLPLAPETGTLLFPILRGRAHALCRASGQTFDICSPQNPLGHPRRQVHCTPISQMQKLRL